MYEIMRDHPVAPVFNTFMRSRNLGHKDWIEMYPVQARLIDGAKTSAEEVLFVDCGGGHGHQAARFREYFPNAPGRIIVQDLKQGLPATPPNGVEAMAHDLFTEQPVKGKRTFRCSYSMGC